MSFAFSAAHGWYGIFPSAGSTTRLFPRNAGFGRLFWYSD
jgi:hypothetical protein